MRNSIAEQLKDYQVEFVGKAQELDETAETSHNPEYQHEMADTLRTLSHTDAQTVEELDEQEQPEEDKPTDTFMLGTRFSDMEEMELDPIWPGWIYSGVITGIIGEEGTGKSTLMTALTARASAGRNGPDGSRMRKGAVIYIGPEEFDEITIIKRLQTEEANLDNVISLQNVLDEDFKLPTHLELLKKVIIHYKASLVVIDPINSCIAKGATLNTNQGARAILSPLQKMLKQTECGLIFINHFTKAGKSNRTSARASGSQGIYDFLRIYCTLSIDETTGKVILHEDKNNLNVPRPANIYIERLKSGKLFFSGGSSADFAVMAEQQRLSMGRQAILKIVDKEPLTDFPGGLIHQCLLEMYPNMPSTTTRSLLKRMSDPGKNGHVDIMKLGYGYYCSTKRPAILAAKQIQKEDEQEQEDTPEKDEGIFQKPATVATVATVQDTTQQATMVL